MQIVTGDGLPNGGLAPLAVTYAEPVTTKPPVTEDTEGHIVCQSIGPSWTTPLVTLMWCVWGFNVPGSKSGSVFTASDVSIANAAENAALLRVALRSSVHLPCISYGAPLMGVPLTAEGDRKSTRL